MSAVLLTIAAAYGLLVVTWVLYLAIMNLAAQRHRMGPVVKVHAYALLLVGYVFDAALNLLVCLAFWRLPRDWLLTGTLKRTLNTESGWREATAAWLCAHLLDPFDPKGKHC